MLIISFIGCRTDASCLLLNDIIELGQFFFHLFYPLSLSLPSLSTL